MSGNPALKRAFAVFCIAVFAACLTSLPVRAASGSVSSSKSSRSSSKSARPAHAPRRVPARSAAHRTAHSAAHAAPARTALAAAGVPALTAAAPRSAATRKTRRPLFSGGDPAKGDVADTDDPLVRQVAIAALGHEKGSVVAVDPTDGRILTIVGQKMAFSAGFEPCSTIKPFIALAGLQEGVITRQTMLPVARRRYMDLTEAMAVSNNKYFETVGSMLGFDRVIKYDALLGLGQRVGYNIPEEQPGSLPPSPPIFGGVARMSSFGSGIKVTPFQLASLVSTLANGGTQYYLQYPRTLQEVQNFEPRIRQQLDIAPLVPDIQQGMLGAVLYGTARRSSDPYGEQALGKTGTCNDETLGGRLGWFASYADQDHPKIVLVVLLHGGARIISGPHASEIAGRIYRGLSERNYFANVPAAKSPPPGQPAASDWPTPAAAPAAPELGSSFRSPQ